LEKPKVDEVIKEETIPLPKGNKGGCLSLQTNPKGSVIASLDILKNTQYEMTGKTTEVRRAQRGR